MKNTIITTYNGKPIEVSNQEGLLPIKPVCEALGIDYDINAMLLDQHLYLKSMMQHRHFVSANGVIYESIAFDLISSLGWIGYTGEILDECLVEDKDSAITGANLIVEAIYGHMEKFKRESVELEARYNLYLEEFAKSTDTKEKAAILDCLDELVKEMEDLPNKCPKIQKPGEILRQNKKGA